MISTRIDERNKGDERDVTWLRGNLDLATEYVQELRENIAENWVTLRNPGKGRVREDHHHSRMGSTGANGEARGSGAETEKETTKYH